MDIWVPWDPKVVMDIPGYLSIFEIPGAPGWYHGIPGISMDIHGVPGIPEICMDLHVFPWISRESGLLGVPGGEATDPRGCYGIPGISMDMLGYPWISMDITRISGSLEIPRVVMDIWVSWDKEVRWNSQRYPWISMDI